MELNWLESMLFGFVSGLTEILPVSAPAHEALLLKFFGATDHVLLRLFIHAAVWEALFLSFRGQIDQMLRERDLTRIPPKRRNRQPDPQRLFDLRLLQTALIPMVLGFLAYPLVSGWRGDLGIASLFLLLNGLILYIPGFLRSGNKDSRSMSRLDGLVMGLCGALGIMPGVSRVAAVSSGALARGADRENALRWSLLLNLAAMLVLTGLDCYELILYGVGDVTLPILLQCFLSAGAAFGGAMLGIQTMRFLAFRVGFSGFGTYSLGAALFAFIMYLTI